MRDHGSPKRSKDGVGQTATTRLVRGSQLRKALPLMRSQSPGAQLLVERDTKIIETVSHSYPVAGDKEHVPRLSEHI